MLIVVLAWVVWGGLFAGLGALVEHWAGGPGGPSGHGLTPFWSGLGAAVVWLQVVQLALPVGILALLPLVVGALLGWRALARRVSRPLLPARWKDVLVWGGFALGALGLAWLALAGPRNGDSGAYHRPAIRWFETYRLVPGLNVLVPPPLDSAYFLLVALVEVGPLAHRGSHVLPSLLVLALAVESFRGLSRALDEGPVVTSDVFRALLLPVVVDLALGRDLTSDSPDLAVTVVGPMLALAVLELAEGEDRPRRGFVRVGLLAGVAVALKPSTAGLALGCGLLALYLVRRRGVRTLAPGAALAAAAALGWVARNVVLTGYPFYPSAALGLPVDWRISPQFAERINRFIRFWGRSSGIQAERVLTGWGWLAPWLRSTLSMNREVVLPLAITAVALLLWAVLRPRRVALPAALGGAVILEVGFWFATAPDLRFLGASLWILAAVAVLPLVRGAGDVRTRGVMLGLWGVLALWPVATHQFVAPGLALTQLSRAPQTEVVPYVTRSGLVVHYAPSGVCWDDEPPCVIFKLPGLALRQPGQLEGGFLGNAWDTFDPGPHPPAFWSAE